MVRFHHHTASPGGKTHRLRASFLRCASFILVCWSLMSPLHADPVVITPGKPTADGIDRFTVTRKDGTSVVVDVDVTKGMQPQLKAFAIQEAINNAGFDAHVNPGGSVNVVGVNSITSRSTSGETDKFALVLLPSDGAPYAQVDYHLRSPLTALAGVDADGGAAIYTAGFDLGSASLGDISLFTSFGFADLATTSLAGLLQHTFDLLRAQLFAQAPSLVDDLALNLSDSAIAFQPSGPFTSIAATNGTTDVALASSLATGSVPEPSSVLMVLTGLLMAFGVHARHHPRQARPAPQHRG